MMRYLVEITEWAGPRLVIAVALLILSGCGVSLGQEAPAECGFGSGTPMSYAGRSTTAELDVQEVVGDPMSIEPADIYITRDAFRQGEVQGRLVCAIYVNHPGFIEITVHPGDRAGSWRSRHSRPRPTNGMTRDDAIDAARRAVPDGDGWKLLVAVAGPIGEVMPGYDGSELEQRLPGKHWIWRVFLARGDRGVQVWIDDVDGTVYGEIESPILN